MERKLISLKELKDAIHDSSLNELGYLLGRYCGPYNMLFRSKIYSFDASKHMTRLIELEIVAREIDNMLTDPFLS